MKNTYVYLIQEKLGSKSPVKIGVARKPEQRLAELQVGNSRELELVVKIGPVSERRAYNTERGLHRKFRRFHLRGEWFSGVILGRLHETREAHQEEEDYYEKIHRTTATG